MCSPHHCAWWSYFSLLMFCVPLPCRPSLTEQAQRGDPAPASVHPPSGHILPALPPHLHDTAEFPTPPLTPPERQSPEAQPTPAASPHPPPPAPDSLPPPSDHQDGDLCPAEAPCHPARYEHKLLPDSICCISPAHLIVKLIATT